MAELVASAIDDKKARLPSWHGLLGNQLRRQVKVERVYLHPAFSTCSIAPRASPPDLGSKVALLRL